MAVYGSYVIESWSDLYNEILFVGRDGHWTPFLTDAKNFSTKDDALSYWKDNKLTNVDITVRWYG